ncbi:MAG: mechanosensitive ion channel [Eubacteriales bacterium]|nr:mechanosensitive ion channel [Eubacteriales bacterium]
MRGNEAKDTMKNTVKDAAKDIMGDQAHRPLSVNKARLLKYSVGLIVCLAAAVSAFLLDRSGVGIAGFGEKHTVMHAIFVVMACIGAFNLLMLFSMLQVRLKKGIESEVVMLGKFNKVLTGFALMIGVAYIFGRLDAFTAFFTMFGGMLLGWSLQAPVSGFAAWIMVTIMRPYRLGDRVHFPSLGLIGDVVKFTPMYLTLNQVGGSIGSEETVGKMINVPNAMLFGQVVINSTYMKTKETASYILDEILFKVTFDSDWDTVESILLNVARSVTADIMEKTGTEPYIRADTWDYGTLFRLRYMTMATDRPRITYEIVKNAIKQIQTNRNVDLAIPYVYSFKRGLDNAGAAAKTGEVVEQIEISKIHGIRLDDEGYWKDNEEEVLEVAKKITEVGLLQPIVVAHDINGEGYNLVFGEKRLKACILLGWEKVPAIIRNPIGIDVTR